MSAPDFQDQDEEREPGRETSGADWQIAPKEYYSMGEVSDIVGLRPHVLRYWESQFPVLNPSKNRSGNRVFQKKEIKLVLLVKHLLYQEKYTIDGARQKLDQLRRGGELKAAAQTVLDPETIALLREEIEEVRELLRSPTERTTEA